MSKKEEAKIKKFTLDIYLNKEGVVAYKEHADIPLFTTDLRMIISVFEQIKFGMITQLTFQQTQATQKEEQEIKAD